MNEIIATSDIFRTEYFAIAPIGKSNTNGERENFLHHTKGHLSLSTLDPWDLNSQSWIHSSAEVPVDAINDAPEGKGIGV